MTNIYILELENNKYYVGKTNNISFRINDHINNNGSFWTKKYKPKKLLEVIENCDNFDEDKYTLKYMEKYGINNVRGGSFCQIKLSESNLITLNNILYSVNDKCYICGSKNHFAVNCKKNQNKKDKISVIDPNEPCDCITSIFSSHRKIKCALNKIIDFFEEEDDSIDDILNHANKIKKNNPKISGECYRCGYKGHFKSECFAKKHIKGYYLKNKN